MNRSDARKIVFSAIIMLLLSLFVLITSALLANHTRQEKIQYNYRLDMGHLIDADNYEYFEIRESGYGDSVRDLFVAYDTNRKVIGYILTVTVTTAEGILASRMAISETGDRLIAIEVLDSEIISLPSQDIIEELISQLQGARIPVALQREYEDEELIYSEYPSVEGLNDGVFYAENIDFDSSGYKDYVELIVKNGRIISVVWDAAAKDGGKNRAQSSVDGEYKMPEGQQIWAVQSYAMSNMLVKVQDLDKLAIKSDGYTEIVDGVEMKVNVFYRLAKECVDNSKNNITKESTVEETSTDESFSDSGENAPVPEISEVSVADESEVSEAAESENDLDSEQSMHESQSQTESTSSETTTVEMDMGGVEDGVVVPGEMGDNLIESVDGLPLSEIRTQILGVDTAMAFSDTLVSAVNTAYKYMRDYVL